MIDVKKIFYDLCEDEKVYDDSTDLIDSGILDSLMLIELFSTLEDNGIVLYPTRIDRDKLRTVKGIEELISDYLKNKKD